MAARFARPVSLMVLGGLSVIAPASDPLYALAPLQMCAATIDSLHQSIERGYMSPAKAARWSLATIERIDRDGPRLASTPFVNAGLVADAAAVEQAWAGKPKPPLYGVTINIKDMFDVAGLPTSVGERTLADQPITMDSTLVRRLKAAGALIVGKGSVNATRSPWLSGFHWGGLTVNPHDESLDPQGSSTGTAVSVASGQAIAGVGEETTDSLRGVADANGLVSIRPTFGRVPTDGMFPFSIDRDVPGSFGRTVADAAVVLNVMTGCHERGGDCGAPTPAPLVGLRLGIPKAYVGKARLPDGAKQLPFDPELLTVFAAAVALLKANGVEVFEVDEPFLTPTDLRLPLSHAHYQQLGFPALDAEAFETLYAAPTARAIAAYLAARSGGSETYRSLLQKLDADSRPESAFLRHELAKFQRHASAETAEIRAVRTQYAAALERLYNRQVRRIIELHRLDGFLFPTAFRPVMTVVGALRDTVYDQGENVLAHAPSDFGLPAITVPMGFTRNARPLTLTLMGDRNTDDRIVAIARAYEAASLAYRSPAGLCKPDAAASHADGIGME